MHLFRRLSLAISVLLLAVAAGAAIDIKVEKYKLPNGMTVILREDHSLPVVTINTWFHVGSKDESPGRSGFAHLFEHLMFMGTERVPTGDFDRIMEAEGAANNASTSFDVTDYFSQGPSSTLPLLLWLDADRLESLAKAMTKEKLDRQREVVLNERAQNTEDTPYGESGVKLFAMVFPPGHPYHIETIGTREDIESATRTDVVSFFNTFYVPNNASLVVAGDFDPAATKPLIADLFGTLPRCPEPPRAAFADVPLKGETRVTLTDKVQFSRITWAWRSPATYKAGDAPLALAASVLAGGKTSRLYKRLVFDEKIATDVSAYQYGMQLGGMFVVEVTPVDEASMAACERGVEEEIASLRKSGPRPDELERIRVGIETSAVERLQDVGRLAGQLNEYDYFLGDPNSFERDLDRFRKATPKSVRKWVRNTLRDDARVVMTVLPEESSPGRKARDSKPGPVDAGKFAPPLPESATLSNGIQVDLWRRPSLPIVSMEMRLEGGSAFDPKDKGGVADLAAEMIQEGTGDMDALAFSDALDRLGADFGANAGSESTSVSLSGLKSNFGKALTLASRAVMQPTLAPADFERRRDEHADDIAENMDEPSYLARIVGQQEYYGPEHPLGHPASGTLASVGKITLEDVKAAHARTFSPRGARILLAGDLTMEEAKALLEGAFGAWKPAAEPVAAPALAPPARQPFRIVYVDRPDSSQTVINFTMPAPDFSSPDRVNCSLLNVVLGGSFTSRLNDNLREKHGYSYGAGSSFQLRRTLGTLTASASVRKDVTKESLAEFAKEFARIRGGDVSEEESRKARESYRNDRVSALSTLDGLLGTYGGYLDNGAGYETLAADMASGASATAAGLNQLARTAVPVENAQLVLVGDKAVILEALKATDLGLPAATPREVVIEEPKTESPAAAAAGE